MLLQKLALLGKNIVLQILGHMVKLTAGAQPSTVWLTSFSLCLAWFSTLLPSVGDQHCLSLNVLIRRHGDSCIILRILQVVYATHKGFGPKQTFKIIY